MLYLEPHLHHSLVTRHCILLMLFVPFQDWKSSVKLTRPQARTLRCMGLDSPHKWSHQELSRVGSSISLPTIHNYVTARCSTIGPLLDIQLYSIRGPPIWVVTFYFIWPAANTTVSSSLPITRNYCHEQPYFQTAQLYSNSRHRIFQRKRPSLILEITQRHLSQVYLLSGQRLTFLSIWL